MAEAEVCGSQGERKREMERERERERERDDHNMLVNYKEALTPQHALIL